MVVEGSVGYLRHDMEHNDRRGLFDYIAKHNRYSTLESAEMFKLRHAPSDQTMAYSLPGGPVHLRRWIKQRVWPKLPARWLFRFLFMYFLRLGFLDGATGFHFCLFMSAYEHQISLKLKELEAGRKREAKNSAKYCRKDAKSAKKTG